MSNHEEAKFLKKHNREPSTEGGACLSRHEGRKENNSCSHIWQAVKKAETSRSVYDWDKYKSLVGARYKTGARVSLRGNLFPSGLSLTKTGPGKNDWDVGKGDNFTNWIKPYWHNAHHIIPNAVLADCMTEAADGVPGLRLLIMSGLLGANYNLNHMKNMVILPMGEQVARALGLPRHLIGAQKGGSEMRSHANYGNNVKDKLGEVMDDYLAILDQKGEGHPAPPNNLSKKKLEDCSEAVYEKILAFGTSSPGAAIAHMPKELFQ